MAYMKKTWRSHDKSILIVDKYHSLKVMPKNPFIREKRRPRIGGCTSELQEKINLRHRTENLSRLIMDNFKPGDWWVTFTLEEKVGVEKFKQQYGKMTRTLRDFYRKHGQEFKYIAVHENLTGRGRLHGHMIIPFLPGVPFPKMKQELEKAWGLGDCHFKPYEGAAMDAARLAAYMTKEDALTTKLNEKAKAMKEGLDIKKLDAEIKELKSKRSRICPSKNLIRTKAVKKQITKAETYRDEIKAPKGYKVVKALSYNGYTIDGYPYQHAVFEADG